MVSSTRQSQQPNGHAPEPEPADAPPNPWAPLVENLRELIDYASYYLSVQADQVRLRIRRAVMAAVLGLLAMIGGTALLVTAIVILLAGIGGGLGELFGGRVWLGYLVTGLAVVILLGLTLLAVTRSVFRISRHRTIEKYAELRQQQRRQYGHDVGSRTSAKS